MTANCPSWSDAKCRAQIANRFISSDTLAGYSTVRTDTDVGSAPESGCSLDAR